MISQSNCRCPLYSTDERNYMCTSVFVFVRGCMRLSACVHLCLCVCICLKFWPQLKWSMASSDWSGILRSPGPTPSNNSHLSSWLSAQQAQGKEEERKEEFGWIHFQKLYKAIFVRFFFFILVRVERGQKMFIND